MRFLLLLVAACGSSSAPDPAQEPPKTKPPVDVPEVKEAGTPIAFAPRGMTVIATRNAVVIDGQSIASITNGAFDAAELEGGALGFKLARLTSFTQAWVAESTTQGRPVDEAGLLLERTLTYRVLIQLMYSIKVAGVRRFAIAAQSNGELISLPIVLPDKKPVPSISRQPGRDLAAQIDALKNQEPKLGVPGKARIAIKAKSVTPARSLSVDAIAVKIQAAYLRGLERCAKAKKPETVTLGFTITEQGRATTPKVSGTSPSAIDCMAGLISGWRFPTPKTAAGEPAETVAELVLAIAPAEDEPESTASATALQGRGDSEAVTPRAPGKDLGELVASIDEVPRLVVSVTDTQLLVWSFTGLEGTLSHPKLAVPLGPTGITAVQTELENVVMRRWQGKPRPAESREIVLMATGKTSLQTVVELMFAIRQTRDRRELFPDIQLSSSFE